VKQLGLFRHAKSDMQPRGARDFDRPLNARGRKGAALIGRHLRDRELRWDKVIASPSARTTETVDLAKLPACFDQRIYLASAATLVDLLREQDDALGAIMLVGHNPGLEDLIFDLVPDDGSSPLRDAVEEKFPTAALAVLELPIERWSDLATGVARLTQLTRPRDLDASLAPGLAD
jgi:phosphohistidine phosphatase